MTSDASTGTIVPFAKVGEAMAAQAQQETGRTPMRALVATVVAVGPADRLGEAAETLQTLANSGTVRGILISEGSDPAPPARVAGNTVALQGLTPPFINNAVAALRLSSLPTLVWWRGGREYTLDGLADLADRIVLDDEAPERIWARAMTLFEDSAFSDLRWARLTQWRALMAHFFDLPEVQAASRKFTRLQIRGNDRTSAALYAAWLTSSIEFDKGFAVEFVDGPSGVPLQEIRLGDGHEDLTLRLSGNGFIETDVLVAGHQCATRIVTLGDQTLMALVKNELRIRARDIAFERAVKALVNVAPAS